MRSQRIESARRTGPLATLVLHNTDGSQSRFISSISGKTPRQVYSRKARRTVHSLIQCRPVFTAISIRNAIKIAIS